MAVEFGDSALHLGKIESAKKNGKENYDDAQPTKKAGGETYFHWGTIPCSTPISAGWDMAILGGLALSDCAICPHVLCGCPLS
jgi:hypothetical protein